MADEEPSVESSSDLPHVELAKLSDDEFLRWGEECRKEFERRFLEPRQNDDPNAGHMEPGAARETEAPGSEAAAEQVFSPAVADAFKNTLPSECTDECRKECRKKLESLADYGCHPARVVEYLVSLREADSRHGRLQGDPSRMTRDKVLSLVNRTDRVADDWDIIFNSPFGEEVLREAPSSDPSASEDEFAHIPQRLHLLAKWAWDIWRQTVHLQRPLYDDILAELLVYVELCTGEPHLNELAILV